MRCWSLLILAIVVQSTFAAPHVEPREFQVRYREGLIWVDVTTPLQPEPLHLLLDSGASVSVLSLTKARELGLKLGPKISVQGVRSQVDGFWPVRLSAKAASFCLPGEFLALDLERLSGACQCPVDGLIGADFFRGRVVQIDFREERVKLLQRSKATPGDIIVRMESSSSGFRVPVRVNSGRGQWIRIDTGCATAFHWVSSKAKDCDLDSQTPAVGLTQLSIPQSEAQLQIGGCAIRKVQMGLHSEQIFPGESGLLGNALLSRFGSITIDSKANRLILGHLDRNGNASHNSSLKSSHCESGN